VPSFKIFGADLNLFRIFLEEDSTENSRNRSRPVQLFFGGDHLYSIASFSTKFYVFWSSFDKFLTFVLP
jgi:hypothetical protein